MQINRMRLHGMNLRSLLYRAASLLGDVNAVRKGTVVKRAVRKVETKLVNKLARKLFKW